MTKIGIKASTKAYEAWLRDKLGKDIVVAGLRAKHMKMAEGPFPFLRATYWRWAETILEICPEFDDAPPVLAVGDIHMENFGTWRDVRPRRSGERRPHGSWRSSSSRSGRSPTSPWGVVRPSCRSRGSWRGSRAG